MQLKPYVTLGVTPARQPVNVPLASRRHLLVSASAGDAQHVVNPLVWGSVRSHTSLYVAVDGALRDTLTWAKPYTAESGWGGDSLEASLAVLDCVVRELATREALVRSGHVRFAQLTVVIGASLLRPHPRGGLEFALLARSLTIATASPSVNVRAVFVGAGGRSDTPAKMVASACRDRIIMASPTSGFADVEGPGGPVRSVFTVRRLKTTPELTTDLEYDSSVVKASNPTPSLTGL